MELVRRSVEIKSSIVSEDEKERGKRSILNFGHTIGHAIESASDFRLLHGEAVAIGMIAESYLGYCLGLTRESTSQTLRSAIEALGLPSRLPREITAEALIKAMQRDKKNRLGHVHFTLLEGLGRVQESADGKWTHRVPGDAIFQALTHIS
jgi:3-dehydroquinate synthase